MSLYSKIFCVSILAFSFGEYPISSGAANAATIFGDNFDTFENMLKSSDAIVIGRVVDSHLKRVPYVSKEKIIRCSEIAVERVVHSKKAIPSTITIETFEGDYYNNRIEGFSFIPPKFAPGQSPYISVKRG